MAQLQSPRPLANTAKCQLKRVAGDGQLYCICTSRRKVEEEEGDRGKSYNHHTDGGELEPFRHKVFGQF